MLNWRNFAKNDYFSEGLNKFLNFNTLIKDKKGKYLIPLDMSKQNWTPGTGRSSVEFVTLKPQGPATMTLHLILYL